MSKGLLGTINEFLEFLRLERHLSVNTHSQYSHDLLKFTSFLLTKYGGKDIQVHQLTTEDIRDFLAYLQTKRHCKTAIISRRISCLRTFCTFLMDREYISVNPVLPIQSPKMPKKLPIYLTESELKQFLLAPNRETPEGARDFAILILFSNTGMRLSELRAVDVDSINLIEGHVRVLGKGSKERIIPIIKPVKEAINEYLDVRPLSDDKAMFLSNQKKRISLKAIQNIVYKYKMLSGIRTTKLSPHKLRHTFATLLHSKDVDILDIQALLGHSSIATTQIYTHTNPKRLQKAVEKLI